MQFKRNVYLHEMGEEIKSSLLMKTLFDLPTIQLFISTWEKNYEDIYHSPPRVSIITRKILIMIIRFARYHLLLGSNSTFESDSMYLDTIQICRHLNEHYYYLISTTSVIWRIDANCSPFQSLNILPCHIRFRTLKTNLVSLKSIFLKYYFKTNTVCLVLLSSYAFTALQFDSSHFAILLWKRVKPRDLKEIRPPIGKIFRK